MAAFSKEEMAHAETVLEKVRAEWLQRPGVTAVDLGFKWSEGVMTGKLAIRVHLAQKKDEAELSAAELFPDKVDGVLVDVIEATYGIQLIPEGEVQLEAAIDGRDQRFDDIPLGVSVGSPNVTAGTLGAKVFDLDTNDAMILSNWHVLVGDPDAEVGLPCWQPGRIDGGNAADSTIALLTRSVLGPYDAAVARLTGGRPVQTKTLEGDAIEDVTAVELGMQVWKSGRTTGRTEGFVDGVNMSVSLNYRTAGIQRLQEVFRIVPRPGAGRIEVSMGGDSGSVWVDEDSGKAVGLHFAGEVGDAPEHGLAHNIMPVIETLGVRFPAQGSPVSEPPVDANEPDPMSDSEPPVVISTPPLSFWQRILRLIRELFT